MEVYYSGQQPRHPTILGSLDREEDNLNLYYNLEGFSLPGSYSPSPNVRLVFQTDTK